MHQVYAIKFAEVSHGRMAQYFLNPPIAYVDQPAHLDFMLWVIRGRFGDIVVDTGFTAEVARRRGRPHFREPTDGLRLLGVDPAEVRHVILTHLHFDHAGDLPSYRAADFYVQAAELAFWTSSTASRGEFRRLVEPEDLEALVRLNLDGRVVQVVGDVEVVPGVTVHLVGGHTAGMQIVSVETEGGTVVLASDASHLFAHVHEDAPAKFVSDLPQMYRAFDTIKSLASAPELIVPGHDAQVFSRHDPVDGLAGIAVRIA